MDRSNRPKLPMRQLQRELLLAERAVQHAGSDGGLGAGCGAIGSLECRLADLQGRLLGADARSLDDVAAKLEVARGLVAGLGPRGYLLDLLDAILVDIRTLQDAGSPPGAT